MRITVFGSRVRAVVAMTALALVGLPGTVSEATEPLGGWTPPEVVSSSAVRWANRPSVVVSDVGRATAVWEDEDRVVWAAHHPAGGTWQEPHRLGRGVIPQVDADARGRVTVVWYGRHNSVQTVDWTPRGGWTKPVTLSPPPVQAGVYGAGVPFLDVGAGGAVAVQYLFMLGEHPDQQRQLRVAYRPPGGDWRIARVTGFGKHIMGGTAAVDPDGNVDLVYSKRGLIAVRKPVGHPWGPRVRLVDDVSGAASAVGPDGRTVVAWSQPSEEGRQVYASKRGAGGWSVPTRISPEGVRALLSDVQVDGNNRATVVYHVKHAVEAVDLPAGGTWQPPTVLAEWTGVARMWEHPWIAVDSHGNALTAWIRMVPTEDHKWDLFTEAAYRSGDTWGPAERVTPEGDGRPGMLDTAVQPDGTGLLVWEHWNEEENSTSIRARWFQPFG